MLWQKVKNSSAVQSWTKDEVLDVAHWARQLISLVLGLVWGVVGLTGIVAMVLYVLIVSGLLVSLIFSHLKVSEEVVDKWSILKESFATGCSGFVITWILLFNILHV